MTTLALAAEPRVNEIYTNRGPLNVVCQPAENNLTGEILPAGQAEVFVARVRYLLSKHEPQKWLSSGAAPPEYIFDHELPPSSSGRLHLFSS